MGKWACARVRMRMARARIMLHGRTITSMPKKNEKYYKYMRKRMYMHADMHADRQACEMPLCMHECVHKRIAAAPTRTPPHQTAVRSSCVHVIVNVCMPPCAHLLEVITVRTLRGRGHADK